MMRLTLAAAPVGFDERVRHPGENALALLAGKALPHQRGGRPIEAEKTVRGQKVKKTIDDFAYWQDCLDDLYQAYHGICAYYCAHVERFTAQVDHAVPKTLRSDVAYDWSNYRLASGYVNTCKREFQDTLDPVNIQDGWFQLNLISLRVSADPALPEDIRGQVIATIGRLKLNEGDALAMRKRALDRFRHGLRLDFLLRDHPYLARELSRQGILTAAQLAPLPPAVTTAPEPER